MPVRAGSTFLFWYLRGNGSRSVADARLVIRLSTPASASSVPGVVQTPLVDPADCVLRARVLIGPSLEPPFEHDALVIEVDLVPAQAEELGPPRTESGREDPPGMPVRRPVPPLGTAGPLRAPGVPSSWSRSGGVSTRG